ncbi:DUF4012 domain-containing protein [Candidatus Peregrinibacteria bacterium]|nr:DUF4012 domain-containing protein [Candidatus Peregrinibacteria bacterium]
MTNKSPHSTFYILHSILAVLIILYLFWLFIAVVPFLRFFWHPFLLAGNEKNYLVVFQNNYELRPTGGFISSFGILTLKNGMPKSFNFEDVYGTVDDHPFVEPPAPMGKLLAHPTYKGYTFRDTNFYPDFPKSVSEMERILHLTRPFQRIDGVFAIDVAFIEKWLSAVGSVKINGEKFEAEHLIEQIENEVAGVDLHDLEALKTRKSVLKSLAVKLGLKSLRPWNLPGFFNAVKESLNEKHILLYFRDEDLQSVVKDKDWGGILEREAGEDFLAVVDANYGGGKSNRYISRSIFYEIDLERGESKLNVRYEHPGDMYLPLSTNYRAYLRAYVPSDHNVKNAEFSGNEGDLFYAGQTFEMPIRSNKTISFDFSFPRSVLDSLIYNLNIRKQPGTFNDFYYVSVRVPTGMRIKSDDFKTAENIAIFSGFLDRDKKLSLELVRDPYPPRIISQELKNLNEFEIWWNEPVSPASLNYRAWAIRDKNVQNPASDIINIEKVESDGTRLIIKTNGMTPQKEEVYELEISGVSDYSGNALGKRTYKFYQRLK